jgi:hypothetical protein
MSTMDADTGPAPLEDPAYAPQHPPVGGIVPEVVRKWGPHSQYRWFGRFWPQLKAQPYSFWAGFYCSSESHRGLCCSSCTDDKDEGYGDDIDGCCCVAIRARMDGE